MTVFTTRGIIEDAVCPKSKTLKCFCGRVATRHVNGKGFCTPHLQKAIDAASVIALAYDAERAVEEFRGDTRRAISRTYRHKPI